MEELKKRISVMKDNQFTTLTIEREQQEKTREEMQNQRKLTVEIPKHKSVVYKDLDFTETFKNLRSLELYSNFYSTELNKNLSEIDEKFHSFRARFEKIKQNFSSERYVRSDKNKGIVDRPEPVFRELENLGDNLRNLYNYHFLYEKLDDSQKLKYIMNELNSDQFREDQKDKLVQIQIFPQQFSEEVELDERLRNKYEDVLARYLALEKKIGTNKKSIKFVQQEPLYKMALRFQNEVETELVKKGSESVKTELANIKEGVGEIQKKLDGYLSQMAQDKYFKDDTQQIMNILQFYKEHQNNEKILKETLKYKSSIQKMIKDQGDLLGENFDEMMDRLEKTLDDND